MGPIIIEVKATNNTDISVQQPIRMKQATQGYKVILTECSL